MNLQAIGIVAVIVGIAMEVFLIGSQWSLGTIIAMAGILIFVYGYFTAGKKGDR